MNRKKLNPDKDGPQCDCSGTSFAGEFCDECPEGFQGDECQFEKCSDSFICQNEGVCKDSETADRKCDCTGTGYHGATVSYF